MADSNGDSDKKRPHLMKKIGTHSGTFHCDEALACALLTTLSEYKDAGKVDVAEGQNWG